ncbi:MAG: hypothetical protein Ta2E_12580 [Mycoplasmoidaceae bacterium]|nr:MAG: hypothetical protein Ta2E_12580 [Mycoplasmoidaceae bacterium]
MTRRHNKVQFRLAEAINKHHEIDLERIKLNKAERINEEHFGDLSKINLDQFYRHRPDVQFRSKKLINGIEVKSSI